MAGRSAATNNLFKGEILRFSALLQAFKPQQKVFGACLTDALDGDAQFIRFDTLFTVLQNGRVAHFLSRLYEHRFWVSTFQPFTFFSRRFFLLFPEVLLNWNFYPLLFLSGKSQPLLLQLSCCRLLRAYSRLSMPFSQVRSRPRFWLWGCLAALILDATSASFDCPLRSSTTRNSQMVTKSL